MIDGPEEHREESSASAVYCSSAVFLCCCLFFKHTCMPQLRLPGDLPTPAFRVCTIRMYAIKSKVYVYDVYVWCIAWNDFYRYFCSSSLLGLQGKLLYWLAAPELIMQDFHKPVYLVTPCSGRIRIAHFLTFPCSAEFQSAAEWRASEILKVQLHSWLLQKPVINSASDISWLAEIRDILGQKWYLLFLRWWGPSFRSEGSGVTSEPVEDVHAVIHHQSLKPISGSWLLTHDSSSASVVFTLTLKTTSTDLKCSPNKPKNCPLYLLYAPLTVVTGSSIVLLHRLVIACKVKRHIVVVLAVWRRESEQEASVSFVFLYTNTKYENILITRDV